MRIRAAVLSALTVLAVLPAVASAGPSARPAEAGVLLVAGQGGTTGELVVDRPTGLEQPVPAFLGGGEYAGVIIEPLDRQTRLGAVVVRAFDDETRDVVTLLGVGGRLEPGRYRVTLLGQGPVEVRYPLQDRSSGLLVQPTTPLPVAFLGRTETLAAGDGEASVVLGRAVPAGKRVVQVGLYQGTTAEDARLCATTGSTCTRQPVCPPSPGSCDAPLPRPRVDLGQPSGVALLHEPATTVRNLVWTSSSYYRDTEGKLRAAALVLG